MRVAVPLPANAPSCSRTASDTALVPPSTKMSCGASRVSSVAVAAGTWSGRTSRTGAPRCPAAALPARASGKSSPVATIAVLAPDGKDAALSAAAVA